MNVTAFTARRGLFKRSVVVSYQMTLHF